MQTAGTIHKCEVTHKSILDSGSSFFETMGIFFKGNLGSFCRAPPVDLNLTTTEDLAHAENYH